MRTLPVKYSAEPVLEGCVIQGFIALLEWRRSYRLEHHQPSFAIGWL
jgi:hypothetical protein